MVNHTITQKVALNCENSRYDEKAIIDFLNERNSNLIKINGQMSIDMLEPYQHGNHLDKGGNFVLLKYDDIVWLIYW